MVTECSIPQKWVIRNELLKEPIIPFIGGGLVKSLHALEKDHSEEIIFLIGAGGVVVRYYSPKFLLLWRDELKTLPRLPNDKRRPSMEEFEKMFGVESKPMSDDPAYTTSQKFWWHLSVRRAQGEGESEYVFEDIFAFPKESRKYLGSRVLGESDEFFVKCLTPDGKAFLAHGKNLKKIISRFVHFVEHFGKSEKSEQS